MAEQEPKPNDVTQTAPGDAVPSEADTERLQAELDGVRSELEKARDLELRALADLENYRKRVSRQMDEERRYAPLPVVRDLLPVLDNLKRTVEAGEKSQDASGLLEGVKNTIKQFYTMLERHHCVPIEALHQPFDPHVHEAVLQQPSAEYPANTVLHEVQTGFKLYDRVVRPTQVIVSTAAQTPDGKQ